MKTRLLSIVVVLLVLVVATVMLISNFATTQNTYNNYLAQARANAEKNLPYNSYNYYKAAFEIKCEDEKVYCEFLEQAKLLGTSQYSTAVNNYIVYFPNSSNAYEVLCQYQYDNASYKRVIATALEANSKGIATDVVKQLYMECNFMLKTIKSGFQEAQSFIGTYARVKFADQYGYITLNGKYLLAPMYEQASMMVNNRAVILKDGKWELINPGGYAVARSEEGISAMSGLVGKWISVCVDGKYGYTTATMATPKDLPYDYASTFKNGVAAVKKGSKWALINSELEEITDFEFEDILLDEFDTCLNGGVIFAKENGKYYLLNSEGEKICKDGFDNAYPFVGSGPAAVCVDGKWGFISNDGKIVIEPQYENAKSFNIGLGAVCVDGKWGYINTTGEIRVACQFEDCLPFTANGVAAVKLDGSWKYVQLLGYDK